MAGIGMPERMIFYNKDYVSKRLVDEGRVFYSMQEALKAHKLIRPFQRQIAWLFEHHPEDDGIWTNETSYFIFYDIYEKRYTYDFKYYNERVLNVIYMSEKAAKHLTQELNSGRVIL